MASAPAARACAALVSLSLASQTSAFTGGIVRPRAIRISSSALDVKTSSLNAAPDASAWVSRALSRPSQRGVNVASLRMSTTEAAETPAAADEGERFEFQAEVGRVMDIIINSLYSNRDVFLRELISNAADACDKKRFLAVTGTEEEGSAPEYRIRLRADKVTAGLSLHR